MRVLISTIINPLTILWILLILAGIFLWRKRRKTAKVLGVIAIIWLLIISTPFIPNTLVKALENKYPPLKQLYIKPATCNILILGGGHTDDPRFPANNQLSTTALGRLAEGIRIHRQLPGSTIITSGYKGKGTISQAKVLAETAELLGEETESIRLQTEPKNTREEAEQYKKLYADSSQLILVTSATHMPRAMWTFKKAGLDPIPAPTNHIIKKGTGKRSFWFWVPNGGKWNR